MPGFGVRVYASGVKVYVVQSRKGGKSVRVTVGRHGVISADEARRRAAQIINRIKAGEEPVPLPLPAKLAGGPTVAEVAARYMEEHLAVRCKPGTEVSSRSVIDNYILPEFGRLPFAAVEPKRVLELHSKLNNVPYAANRAVAVLSRMFNMAEAWGMVREGSNPCRLVVKHKERKRERFLTEGEFRRLGQALSETATVGGVSPRAVAAIRLLMLTRCRKNEILTLRWEDVDLAANELRLADSKTGPRVVPLSPAATRVLTVLPRISGNPWVIPGHKPGTCMKNLHDPWKIIRTRARLEDVRLHDLRHSFASRALALGENLPMIGKLLGHAQIQTTARYAHLERDSVKASAARVAASIGADFLSTAPRLNSFGVRPAHAGGRE